MQMAIVDNKEGENAFDVVGKKIPTVIWANVL